MTTMSIDVHHLTPRRLQFIGIDGNKLMLKSINIIQSSNNYNIISSFICWNQNIVHNGLALPANDFMHYKSFMNVSGLEPVYRLQLDSYSVSYLCNGLALPANDFMHYKSALNVTARLRVRRTSLLLKTVLFPLLKTVLFLNEKSSANGD